jgi:hypothetical protein
MGAVGCSAGEGGSMPGDEPEVEAAEEAVEQDDAEITLLREAIERGLHIGKTTLSDEINVVLGDHGITERYRPSLETGIDYVPASPTNSCDFLDPPEGASLECRALVTFATVSAYARTPAQRADEPLEPRFDEIREEGEFWYAEGSSSGIDNEATLALSALRSLGVCDQAPEPAKSAYEAGVEHGRQLYIDHLNDRLADLGQDMEYPNNIQQIQVCTVDTTMLGPALTEALDDADGYASDNPLCESFAPSTVEQVALRDDVDRQFNLGIRQGATTEHSLAEEAIFEEVPCNVGDPLVVDVAGDGVSLEPLATSRARFDLFATGSALPTAWIRGDDAWLVLDRDGDGAISSGRELFGNFVGDRGFDEVPTGFDHLARYDRASEGGNGDGVIDASDAIFDRLRLWQDADGDGRSCRAELHRLGELGIAAIRLSYVEHRGSDPHLSHRSTFVRTDEGRSEYGSASAGVYDAWLRHGRARVW